MISKYYGTLFLVQNDNKFHLKKSKKIIDYKI